MNFLHGTRFFSHPEPRKTSRAIYPVFLPFSGCPQRCLFCAQDIQTGVRPRAGEQALRDALDRAEKDIAAREERGAPAPELGFFGGTFTALPPGEFALCLDAAMRWRTRGLIAGARCSTRPDALSPAALDALKSAGFALVELGVQSFSDAALALVRRGYDGGRAKEGCLMVREAGLGLGIQLMPGMPGLDPASALRDAETAAALAPVCARLYPCLVLEGTALADWWRQGRYKPWSLEASADCLARSCLALWRAEVAVIRMGLAEEPGLAAQALAGPRHPNIGGMARGLALYYLVREELSAWRAALPESSAAPRLFVPSRFQGEFWGQRGDLAPAYTALGLTRERVCWWHEERFALAPDCFPR